MKKLLMPIIGTALLFAIEGCASPQVGYTELDPTRPLTTRIEPQDIRNTVEQMVDSLIADDGVLEATNGKKPVLDIALMKNRSQMILDMKSITDSVRTRLLRSKLFRFVDRSTTGDDIDFMDEQAQLGLTDSRKAIRPGKHSAAEMYLTGSLTDMVTRAGRVTDHYYKFTMILKDLRSGEIVWSEEKEIRKGAVRPMF